MTDHPIDQAETPPPGLAQQLAQSINGIRIELGGIREKATNVGRLYPTLDQKMTDILQGLMSIASYLTMIEVLISVKKQVGELAPTVPQVPLAELELVAMSEDGRRRMLASLHRAGDHTQDEEERR